jgi:pyruvate dehydrogenase E2 component (dihydrolipoamide acetyltransferase)
MDVLMPQLGETVAEGKITKWFKSAGDAVKPGDNLFEIETDKVSMEVPSIAAGTLTEIRVQSGETALVGAVVAIIAGEGGAVASAPAPAAPSKARQQIPFVPAKAGTQGQTSGSRVRGDERVATPREIYKGPLDPFFEVRTPSKNYGPANVGGTSITPLARRLAGENGIDLSRMSGSGPHGRIVASDIEAAISKGGGRAAPMATGMSAQQVLALYQGIEFEEVPLDGMRSTIARRLVEAKQTIPHFYLVADVTMDALLKIREEANAGAPKDSYKLSVNDFVIKALALALQRVPAANAVWAGDRILRFKHSDVGIAVAIEGGLLTPVIRSAEGKSLSAISNEMKDLAARAKDKKLKPAEYQGGASAISNLGMYGVREFSAIINPPHATILAVGAAQRRPVEAADGSVKFVSQMTATLSCDHRVVDGALGAELLAAFKALIESPVRMLV